MVELFNRWCCNRCFISSLLCLRKKQLPQLSTRTQRTEARSLQPIFHPFPNCAYMHHDRPRLHAVILRLAPRGARRLASREGQGNPQQGYTSHHPLLEVCSPSFLRIPPASPQANVAFCCVAIQATGEPVQCRRRGPRQRRSRLLRRC